METDKAAIGKRLREVRGPRSAGMVAERLGLSERRIRQMEEGNVPDSWLYLAKLKEEGVSLDYIIAGDNGGR